MGRNRKAALSVTIEDGAIVIRVGIETLAFVAETSGEPGFAEWDGESDFKRPNVVDDDVFAGEVVAELQREQEDGSTPVHLLLDKAMLEAAESGSAGARWPGDPEWTQPPQREGLER